jgi:hypothetical protein
MSNLLIPCTCHKCGVIGESNLSLAGPHIKQSCPSCGAYQKFYDKNLIPDAREIKILIFGAAKQNLAIINAIKQEINFVEGLKGLDQKLQYYKLYKAIINKCPKN